jgi:hypothetical protein
VSGAKAGESEEENPADERPNNDRRTGYAAQEQVGAAGKEEE